MALADQPLRAVLLAVAIGLALYSLVTWAACS